jgi:ATP-binding cassette subfamily B protein
MTNEVSVVNMLPADLAAHWGREVQNQLHSEENVLATLEVDLNQTLQFVRGLVVVTNRRLLCRVGPESKWQHWEYRADLELRHHDHAGVGHLDLLDATGLLATWRFTLGQNLQAIRIVDQFQAHLDSAVSGRPLVQALKNICPSCKAPLDPDQEECPICTKVVHTPPSTWTL